MTAHLRGDARKRQTDAHQIHPDPAVCALIERERRAAAVAALRIVRLVEADMAECAFLAWRSADARRGLSDHEALLVHADALTRWSERLRLAFDGEDYDDHRADRIERGDA